MAKLNKKDDYIEKDAVEEVIDGSTMEEGTEALDSVARASEIKETVEEPEAEADGDSDSEEVDADSEETAESEPEEAKEEETDGEVSESETSVEESEAADASSADDADGEDDSAEGEDPDGEHKVDISRAKWYTIRTFSGQEKKVRDSLLANIHREGMDESIFEVLVPTENVIEMRDGKKRSRVKVFFPGYILVQMDMNKETQFLIEETYGVLNFIGPGNRPQQLKEKELRRILGDSEERKKRNIMAAPYAVGDSIKVVDGPFNDFSGYVQEINEEKQKVKVMVSIFGRATPVELDFLQVALEK